MSLSTNTTYRVYVEKLGASDPTQFVGDEGELFYDPSSPSLFLSDGSTPGGVPVAGGGGGQWTTSGAGIYYDGGNVAIGGPVSAGSTVLMVHGDARVTGILSVGNATITLDPNTNTISAYNFITNTNYVSSLSSWVAEYGDVGINTVGDYFSSAKFDSQGNIYVSGTNGTVGLPFLIKYDPDGNVIWQKFFDSSVPNQYSVCEAVSVDRNTDDVYITIATEAASNPALVKLNSDGDILWQKEIGDELTYDIMFTISVSSSGNVYIGGISSVVDGHFLVVKFDSDGNDIWQRGIGYSTLFAGTGQIVVDSDENLYCTFRHYRNYSYDNNGLLIKLDSDGNEVWQKYFDYNENREFSWGVAVDTLNNVCVVGTINESPPNEADVELLKFDPDGNLIWQRKIENAGYDEGVSIAIDENDKIYVHSVSYGPQFTSPHYNYQLSSFDSDGNILWGKKISYISGSLDWWWYWGINYLDVYDGSVAVSGIKLMPTYSYSNGFIFKMPTSLENVDGIYGDFTVQSVNPIVAISTASIGISTLIVGIATLPISDAGIIETTPPYNYTSVLNYRKLYNQNEVIISDRVVTQDFTLNQVPFGKTNGYYGNIIIGKGAGSLSGGGAFNNFFGCNAGAHAYNAGFNNFFGQCAGYFNCYGSYNNFFGQCVGHSNFTGCHNNFFGQNAGFNNIGGCNNNFFGRGAGYSNNYGSYNTFFGSFSGCFNTIGSCNIFFGSQVGISTSASRKIIIGTGSPYYFAPAFSAGYLFDAPDPTKDTQLAIGIRNDSSDPQYWIVGNENFNIGIGTTNPTSKLTVKNGDIEVGSNTSQGVILTSPNGTKYRIVVSDIGDVSSTVV